MHQKNLYSTFLISLSLILSLWTYQGYSHNYHKTSTLNSFIIGCGSQKLDYTIFNYRKAFFISSTIQFIEFSFDTLKANKTQTINQTLQLLSTHFSNIKVSLISTTQINTTIQKASCLS